MDVYFTEKSFEVRLPLAGVKYEDIEVHVTADDLLIIRAVLPGLPDSAEEEGAIIELPRGRICQCIDLPSSELVDVTRGRAGLKDGMLTVWFIRKAPRDTVKLDVHLPLAA